MMTQVGLTKFEELEKYKAEHGGCIVPRRKHPGLGAWVDNQRSFYKYTEGNKRRAVVL